MTPHISSIEMKGVLCQEKVEHWIKLMYPHVHTHLDQIKNIDQAVQYLQSILQPKREEFLQKVPLWKQGDAHRRQILQKYNEIQGLEDKIDRKSAQKVKISQELQSLVQDFIGKLGINSKSPSKQASQKKANDDEVKEKVEASPKVQQKEVTLGGCHCGRTAFGEMAMCQSTRCKREWFHVECIEKKRPEKWYCRDCRNSRQGQSKRTKRKQQSSLNHI